MNRGSLLCIVLAALMGTGCVTTYQTARVLPKGERIGGMGVCFPPMVEYYSRWGLGRNMEGSIKIAGSIGVGVFGEFKYQIPRPYFQARALVIGCGAFMGPEGRKGYILYPTYLISSGDIYAGARLIGLLGVPIEGWYSGVVLGRVYRLEKPQVNLLPEVSFILGDGGPGLSAGISVQRRR